MLTAWDVERAALRSVLSVKRRSLVALGRPRAKAPTAEWANATREPAETIIVGDSIARRIPSTLLPLLCPEPIVNHGWGGDTTDQVAERIDVSISRVPHTLVLQCGTNDVLQGIAVERVAGTFRRMIDVVRTGVPDATFVVTALPPMARWRGDPSVVQQLNESLRTITDAAGARFADVYQVLSGPTGLPRAGFTTDGVHLSESAYREYVSVLHDAVNSK